MDLRLRLCKKILVLVAALALAFPLVAEQDDVPADGDGKVRVRPDESGTDERFFFGSNDDFEQTSEDNLFDHAFDKGENDDSSSGVEEENRDDQKWVDEDISPLFPELKILDDVSSETSMERLEQARRQYRESLQTIKAGEFAAKRTRAELEADRPLKEEAWRNSERTERIRKHMEQVRAEYRREAVGRLTRAIRILDSIQNPSVRDSAPYLDLKEQVFRQYVKQQFKSRNLTDCIFILERYMSLREDNKQDPEAHRLLAACYRYEEVLADRRQDHKNHTLFKKKKNGHLLRYALLAYGKDSPEYDAIHKRVRHDMVEVLAGDE